LPQRHRAHRGFRIGELETPKDPLTEKIIAAAIEGHRHLGPGLLESIYENSLCRELGLRGIRHERQVRVPVTYKEESIGEHRIDLLVEDQVVIEIKSVDRLDPVFDAQLLSYLRLTGKRVGLLINFNTHLLKNGIKRRVL
jgi:GxxExxY protein